MPPHSLNKCPLEIGYEYENPMVPKMTKIVDAPKTGVQNPSNNDTGMFSRWFSLILCNFI